MISFLSSFEDEKEISFENKKEISSSSPMSFEDEEISFLFSMSFKDEKEISFSPQYGLPSGELSSFGSAPSLAKEVSGSSLLPLSLPYSLPLPSPLLYLLWLPRPC